MNILGNKLRYIAYIIMIILSVTMGFSSTNKILQKESALTGNDPSNMPYYENMLIIKSVNHLNIDEVSKIFYEHRTKVEIKSIDKLYSFFTDRHKDDYGLSRIYRVIYFGDTDPAVLSHSLTKRPVIEYAEPIYKHKMAKIPNDPLYTDQYELRAIDAARSWEISTGSPEVVIAIVDNEFDWRHRDLSDNVYLNQGESGTDNLGRDKRFNGIDDDGNGFVDDYHGWDFMSNTTYAELLEGTIKQDNDTRINEQNAKSFHGTLVASVASAVSDNERGIASPGWSCKIMPVKIRSDHGIGGAEHQGILYAAMMGADIINCSWVGVGFNDHERDVVKQAVSMGSLIIASAGNSGVNIDFNYYNNSQYVMYVGASDRNDDVADFSDFGVLTAVFAPGKEIQCCSPFDNYTTSTGSSLSAPLVSGVAGLIKSVHPDWTNFQIWHQIRSTSNDVFSGNDKKKEYYYGRLNAYDALRFNEVFDTELSVPGVRYTNCKILTESGEIDTYETVKLQFDIINYLSPTENMLITLESIDGLIIPENDVIIENLGNLEEQSIELSIRLSEDAKWYDEISNMIVHYKSNNYDDYQLIRSNIAPPSKKDFFIDGRYVDSLTIDDYEGDISTYIIHSPDIHTCWMAGVNEDHQPFFAIANSDGIIESGYFAEGLYGSPVEIYAYDDKIAYAFLFISGESNTIWKTTNAGKEWQKIKLDKYIDYVPQISFFNRKYGYAIANLTTSEDYTLLTTDDYGDSWQNSEVNDFSGESLLPINTNYSKNILITDMNHQFKTEDFGSNWVRSESNLDTAYIFDKIYFTNTKKAALISFRDDELEHNNFFAYTKDNINKWEIIDNNNLIDITGKHPLNNFFSIPDADKYVVFADIDNIIITDDDGENWYPLKNDLQNIIDTDDDAISSFSTDGHKGRLWISDNSGQIAYLDFDDVFLPPDVHKQKEIAYHTIYPNPAYEEISIQLYLSDDSDAILNIYDIYGRNIHKDIIYAKAYQYHTFKYNITNISDGIYFYSLESGNSIATGQFVVMKNIY